MKKKEAASSYFMTYVEKSKDIYKFIALQNEYLNIPHEYGDASLLTMVESHTLTSIEENPGITITELARMYRRTKGAVSQTVTRLENKGYIERSRHKTNARKVLLYANEAGVKLSRLHKTHNLEDSRLALYNLLKQCSLKDLDVFFKVVNRFNNFLEQELDKK